MKLSHDSGDILLIIGTAILWFFSSQWMREYGISPELYSDRLFRILASLFIVTTVLSWKYMKNTQENNQKISGTDYLAYLIAAYGLSGLIFVVMSMIFD